MCCGITGLKARQAAEHAAAKTDHDDRKDSPGRQHLTRGTPRNPRHAARWQRGLIQFPLQAPEQQHTDQAGQRRQIKRSGHRVPEGTRGAAEQWAAADPGHHAARQQGEVSGALCGCHQACHDDRPEGVEHAPTQAQQ
ncbi:hypothetical protein D3C85_1055180 [compost metagenome]